jgi:hypothetical protein
MHPSRVTLSGIAALGLVAATAMHASAASRCDRLLALLGGQLADASCIESTDLTTNNAQTTPADNSITSLPAGAFTPVTDRSKIAPPAGARTPITRAVPGLQIGARIASDPLGEARIVIRLPDNWNGRMVVAGASGTRSEYNGDYAWSDYVVQRGYAYVSQNKGTYNLYITALPPILLPSPPTDPLSCRLNPASTIYVHFYDNDPGQEFTRWNQVMLEATVIGRTAVGFRYGRPPVHTYAVGTSNGGYQVRRAVETAPELFDGGVDWEGTFVDAVAPNLLTSLPVGILNYPDYAASGFSAASTAAKNMRDAGYPPDLVNAGTTTASLWGQYYGDFWEVTQCQWQKRLDPAYDTYGAGTGTYSYLGRLPASDVGTNMAAFATTGRIKRPLITVAGTMDALLPIDVHARAYARKVEAALDHDGDGDHDRGPAYRLYEVQNGNHIETYAQTFPQLQFIEPHAQKAFDLLVSSVEMASPLPPSQCIPVGGQISATPAQPGHCANLLQ